MTALERAIIQVLAGIVLVGACWWGFSSHYERKGYERCQAEARAAEDKRDEEGGRIAAKTVKTIDKVVVEATVAREESETKIKTVYRDRWLEPKPGRCSVEVDPRVMDEINAAVSRSNGE